MRYIDADRLIAELGKIATCYMFSEKNFVDTPFTYGILTGVKDAIKLTMKAPTVNVARDALSDAKKQIHDKAVYPHNSGIDPYISLRVLDAIVQGEITKRMADIDK